MSHCVCGHPEEAHLFGGRCRVPGCTCDRFWPIPEISAQMWSRLMTAEQAKDYRIVDAVISTKPTTRPVKEAALPAVVTSKVAAVSLLNVDPLASLFTCHRSIHT